MIRVIYFCGGVRILRNFDFTNGMKQIASLFIFFISQLVYGRANEEDRNLVFDSIDLKITQRADSILSDSLKWNKQDDRECNDDIATGKYSLYCSLYKACIDVSGTYVHRRRPCK